MDLESHNISSSKIHNKTIRINIKNILIKEEKLDGEASMVTGEKILINRDKITKINHLTNLIILQKATNSHPNFVWAFTTINPANFNNEESAQGYMVSTNKVKLGE